MGFKKVAAILVLCTMAMSLSACGNGSQDISSNENSNSSSSSSSSEEDSSSEADIESEAEDTESDSSESEAEESENNTDDVRSSSVAENSSSNTQISGIDSVDFENGDIYTAHCKNSENYTDDESKCNFSVEEYNGSKQLRIQILDKREDSRYKVPKVVFDVDQLVGKENVSKIKSVKADITAVAVGNVTMDNGSVVFAPGNCIGGFFAEAGEGSKEFVTLSEFEFSEWGNNFITQNIQGSILKEENRYKNGDENCTFIFMRWDIPNQADIYIDNITFLDDNGNIIPITYNG